MKNIFTILMLTVFVSACATPQTVGDASSEDSINTVSMTCKKPYVLSQDCSIWSGATRTLDINGFKVKVGGSEDGKVVLVMDSKSVSNLLFKDVFTLTNQTHSIASNNSYYAIKNILEEKNIKINKVRPLKSFGNINGYVLLLDEDGYTTLKEYTKKKK